MSLVYRKQKKLRGFAVLLVATLTLMFGFGVLAVTGSRWETQDWSSSAGFWFACFFVSVNCVTWLMFYYDKRIAGRKGVVRVPENTFFLLAVLGGLPSLLVAMQLLRHKRSKSSFKWSLFGWFAIVYSLVGAAVLFWLNRMSG